MENMTIHRLRRSDSLEALSALYHVPICMIMRANGLDAGWQLSERRELRIPHKCHCNRCAPEPASYTRYIVRRDDTLYGIARGFGLTMRILLKANGMADPDDMRPGEVLRIPRLTGDVYCVRDDDRLDGIARHYGTTADRIRKTNWMETREEIYPGMLLLISAG